MAKGENVLEHWFCTMCAPALEHVSIADVEPMEADTIADDTEQQPPPMDGNDITSIDDIEQANDGVDSDDGELTDESTAPPRPDLLEESLISEPEPVDIPEAPLQYKILPNGSSRGKPMLFAGGFSYTIKRKTLASTTWRCSKRVKHDCDATIREVNGTYIHGPHPHSHLPNPGDFAAAKVTVEAKQLADADHRESARDIVIPLINKHFPPNCPTDALSKVKQIADNANYYRRKKRPHHPKDMDFDILAQRVPDDFLRDDIRVDTARHIILATPMQLKLLAKAKTWYMDATFKLVKTPFYQLFTINGFIRSHESIKQIPLVMVIM